MSDAAFVVWTGSGRERRARVTPVGQGSYPGSALLNCTVGLPLRRTHESGAERATMMRTVLSALALLAVESAALRLPHANRREMFKFAAGVPAIALPAVASAHRLGGEADQSWPLEMAAAVKPDITERQFLVTDNYRANSTTSHACSKTRSTRTPSTSG